MLVRILSGLSSWFVHVAVGLPPAEQARVPAVMLLNVAEFPIVSLIVPARAGESPP